MARLKILMLIGVMGVTLGGAGPLLVGRADGATPILASDYEKLPVHLRADQAKQKAKEAKKEMAKRNLAERSRTTQSAKARKELKKEIQGSTQDRAQNQDELQQEKLRNETLLAAADDTLLKSQNPAAAIQPNGETRYSNPLDPVLLMNERANDQEDNEEANSKENTNAVPRKKGPSNAWRIMLAAAEAPMISPQGTAQALPPMEYRDGVWIQEESSTEEAGQTPAQQLRELEEMFRNQQNLIHMASVGAGFKPAPTQSDLSLSRSTIESVFDWREGMDTQAVDALSPSENHGTLTLAACHPDESNKKNEEKPGDEAFAPLGSRPSRVFEL